MAIANVTVSSSVSNITVDSSLSNITVTNTPSNVIVSANPVVGNAQIRSALSVTDAGGDGSLSYNSSTGVFTYTGPSASEVRAHFSATSPISITDGNISIDSNALFSGKTTDDLAEGSTNLYFTTARANSAIGAYQGDISTAGNITAAFFIGDGSQLTNIQTTSNADILQFLATSEDAANMTFAGPSVSGVGPVTSLNFLGNVRVANNLTVGDQEGNTGAYVNTINLTGNIAQQHGTDYTNNLERRAFHKIQQDGAFVITTQSPVSQPSSNVVGSFLNKNQLLVGGGYLTSNYDSLLEANANISVLSATGGASYIQSVNNNVTADRKQGIETTDNLYLNTGGDIFLLPTASSAKVYLHGNRGQLRDGSNDFVNASLELGNTLTSNANITTTANVNASGITASGNIETTGATSRIVGIPFFPDSSVLGNINGYYVKGALTEITGDIGKSSASAGEAPEDIYVRQTLFTDEIKPYSGRTLLLPGPDNGGGNIVANIPTIDGNSDVTKGFIIRGQQAPSGRGGGNANEVVAIDGMGNVTLSLDFGNNNDANYTGNFFKVQTHSSEDLFKVTHSGNVTAGVDADNLHTFTGNLNVTGNVEVSGNLNYRNVEDLYVQDQSITLNANAATDATSSIIINRPVAGSNTVVRWNETDDKWQFSNDGSTYQNLIGLTDFSVTTNTPSGNGSLAYSNTTGVFTFTPADAGAGLTNADAQAYIQENGLAMTANLTSNSLISTTGNLQVNPDTVVGGLKGLTFDSATNRLGLGTTTPEAGIHIFSDDDQDAQIFFEEYRNSFNGPDLRFKKARGTASSPTVVSAGDRQADYKPYGYTGSGFLNTLSMIAATDSANTISSTVMPTVFSWEGYKDGDNSTSYMSLMKLRSNGDFQIGSLGFNSSNTAPNFAVTHGGQVDAVGNITTTANINAAGGTLTGIITSNSNIETSAFFVGDLDGAVVQDVRNETGATLSKGKAVYLTGSSTGDNPHVALADADDSSKMPALGIVYTDIANASIGQVVTSGVINVASHGFTEGADLFVGTTAGDLTTTAPTGESSGIQKIGKVVSANHILVQGAFRQNATPNLDDGKIFLGNAANQASTATLDTSIVPENTNLYYTTDRANSAIEAHTGNIANLTGELKTTGNANFLGGNVEIGDTSAIYGLRNLKYDATQNRLGIGTGDNVGKDADGSTMTGAVHILSDNSTNARLNFEELRNSTTGPDIRYFKARGTYSSPAVVNAGDRISEAYYSAHDGSDYGSSRARQNVFVDDRSGTGSDISNGTIIASYEFGVNDSSNTNIYPMQIQGGTGDVLFGLSASRNSGTPNAKITHSGNVHTNIILPQSGSNVKIDTIKPVTQYGNITTNGNLHVSLAEFEDSGTATANITAIISHGNQGGAGTADSIVLSTELSDGTLVVPSGITDSGFTEVNNGSYYTKINTGLGFGNLGVGLYTDSGLTTPARVMTGSSFIGSPSGTPIVTYAAGTFANVKDANLIISGHTSANTLTASANVVAGTGANFAKITPTGDSANTSAALVVVSASGNPGVDLIKGSPGTNKATFIQTQSTGPTSGDKGSPLVTNAQTIQLNSGAAEDANVGFQIFTGGNGVQLLHDGSADEWILNTKADQTFYRVTTTDDFGKNKSYSNTAILALTGMTAGDMVYNSTDNLMAYYDGTNWRNIAQGAIVT